MNKRIDLNVELNPRIFEVMRVFKPRVGSNDDILIIEVYTKLLNLETLKRDARIRVEKTGKVFRAEQAKEDEIMETENRLLWLMKNRNEKINN